MPNEIIKLGQQYIHANKNNKDKSKKQTIEKAKKKIKIQYKTKCHKSKK